jgi:tetratricopeptide (TPR) repeat protein
VALFLLAAVILCAELFAVSLLLEEKNVEALLIHVVCCLVAYVYTVTLVRTGKGARFGIMFSILLTVLGPFGAAGTMLMLTVFKLTKNHATSFTEWYYSIFPEDRIPLSQQIADSLQYGRDKSWQNYSIIPFIDIIKRGSESQKREAILKMTQFFHPDFGAVIKMALQEDSSNVVRVQAATAITKIKNNFFSQLMNLEKLRKKYPDKNEILLAIASVYDDLAFSTILEPEQETEARQLAMKFYEEFRVHRPNDKRIHYLIGRLLMRQSRFEEAAHWLGGAITSETAKLDIWVLYAECLYRLKRFDDLRRQARSNCDLVLQARKYPDAICESVLFWSGRQAMNLSR